MSAGKAQKFPPKIMNAEKKAVLALALLSYFVVALDGSIVFTGLEKISADLNLNITSLSWIQNAYVLAFGGFMLIGGRLGDIAGRKFAVNLSLAGFAAGSLLVGTADTAAVAIFARFVQGAAAAVLAPAALALIMDYFSGDERTKAVAWYGSISGLGLCVGLILGGLLTSLYSWRIGFVANLPLSAFMIFISAKYLRPDKAGTGGFDICGTLLSVCGIFAFVYAVNGAENFAVWLAAALFLLALFALVESKKTSPLIAPEIFASSVRRRAYIARILFVGALMGLNFFMSEYMQTVLGFDSFECGLGFFPLTICTFLGAVKVPRLVKKYGDYKTLLAGIVLMVAGFSMLVFADAKRGYPELAIAMLFIGFGQGLGMSPLTNLGINGIGKDNAGAAAGVVNAAHQIGGAAGLSIMVRLSEHAANAAQAFGMSMTAALVFTAAILPVVFARRKQK